MPIDFSQTTIREVDALTNDNVIVNGACYSTAVRNSGQVSISIDSGVKRYMDSTKLATVYHEIGHCFLGLQHVAGKKIMSNENLGTVFLFYNLNDDSERLRLVKEMLEGSAYR